MSDLREPIFYVLEPSTGYTKFQHRSFEAAEREARRLSYENPGREFLVLQARWGCRFEAVTEIHFSDPEIPF